MEGKHRHLYTETDEHAAKDPKLSRAGNTRRCASREQSHIKGAFGRRDNLASHRRVRSISQEEQGQEADQHEGRAEQRVKKELERCVAAIVATPDTDQEEHWQQHNFEEDEEQDQVLGDKRAEHAGL